MIPRSVFLWLDANLPGSVALRESNYGFAIFLTSHAVTMAIFFGLIMMMDLRLVGVGSRHTSFSQLQKSLFPWQMTFMVLNSITGMLLFYSQPLRYYGKVFFWMKMSVMALAGLNALAFHLTSYRSVAAWDNDLNPPAAAKFAGIASIVLWAVVLMSGRLTAYEWLTYQYDDF